MTPRPYLALVPRRTLAHWTRQRLVDIHAELSALRQDKARLLRLSTRVSRCDACRVLKTVTIQETGWWVCNRCAESAKGATA